MQFNCLKATTTSRRQFTFCHSVPRNSWYSFYRPQKDERLSRPWSHPVVLNIGLLDWESSALTTRPLLDYPIFCFYFLLLIFSIIDFRDDTYLSIYLSLFDVTSAYPSPPQILGTLATLGFLMPSWGTRMQHCKEMS